MTSKPLNKNNKRSPLSCSNITCSKGFNSPKFYTDGAMLSMKFKDSIYFFLDLTNLFNNFVYLFYPSEGNL